jgi:hypothetical protein
LSGSQLLKFLLGVVEVEEFLDAVEVFSHVVFVLMNIQSLVDLPLHYYSLIFNYN